MLFCALRRWRTSTLVAACALWLSACGGGDSAAPAPAPDPLASYRQQTLQWQACDPSVLLLLGGAQAVAGDYKAAARTYAEALAADPQAAAPLLTAIAEARSLPVLELASRVLGKMNAYAGASGALIGRRQAAEDLIDSEQLQFRERVLIFLRHRLITWTVEVLRDDFLSHR